MKNEWETGSKRGLERGEGDKGKRERGCAASALQQATDNGFNGKIKE